MGDFNMTPEEVQPLMRKLHITADHINDDLPHTWNNRGITSTIDYITSDMKIKDYTTHEKQDELILDHHMVTGKIDLEYHTGKHYNWINKKYKLRLNHMSDRDIVDIIQDNRWP